jgi:hypothetical protein
MISFKAYFESNVLKLYETIYLENLGELKAMSDSGNSAYNVLDGRDIEIFDNGKKVKFISTEKNLPVEKDIIDSIKIHIGSNVNEDRPVVLFNIKFKGNEYKNIQFSIADRSGNETPILLGREFFETLKNSSNKDVFIKTTD